MLLFNIFPYFKQITMCPFNVLGLMNLSFQGRNMDSFIPFKQVQQQKWLVMTTPPVSLSKLNTDSINVLQRALFIIGALPTLFTLLFGYRDRLLQKLCNKSKFYDISYSYRKTKLRLVLNLVRTLCLRIS
jgi:hypothetical protein